VTTVLADAHLGVMVADSFASDGDRSWGSVKKVWRVKQHLIGFAGHYGEFEPFIQWFKDGCDDKQRPKFSNSSALILGPDGLRTCQASALLMQAGRHESIGTGAKAALAAYEALGFTDPKRAVQIACRYDAGSRPPVRVYHLKVNF
jgi:hypothetical protein